MIGQHDPGGTGSRAVRSNFRELANRGLIDYDSGRAGFNPTITLRDETRPRAHYTVPGEVRESYFRVPESLWRRDNVLPNMDGAALAVYLVLLHYFRHDRDMGLGTWFAANSFAARHGISETTKNRGLDRLVALGVAHSTEQWLDSQKYVGSGYQTFRRRYYLLDPAFQPPKPANVPTPEPTDAFDVPTPPQLGALGR